MISAVLKAQAQALKLSLSLSRFYIGIKLNKMQQLKMIYFHKIFNGD